jgi:hypothetical protein
MDLIPLNLNRDTVCDAGVAGAACEAGAASTSWSGRGDRKSELRNMMLCVCVYVLEKSSRQVGIPYIRRVV